MIKICNISAASKDKLLLYQFLRSHTQYSQNNIGQSTRMTELHVGIFHSIGKFETPIRIRDFCQSTKKGNILLVAEKQKSEPKALKNFRQYFCKPLFLQIFLSSEMRLLPQAPLTLLAGIWGAEPVGFTVGYFQMLWTPFTAEYHQQTHLLLIPACSLFITFSNRREFSSWDQATELHRCHTLCNTVHSSIVSCPLISENVLLKGQWHHSLLTCSLLREAEVL